MVLGIDESVNDLALHDNCYYCTAAALKGMTVSALVTESELMQYGGGGSLESIQELFITTGLSDGSYTTHRSKNSLINEVRQQDPTNASKRWGLAYTRRDRPGHMVILQRGLATGILILDYQQFPMTLTDEIPPATIYYLFPADELLGQIKSLEVNFSKLKI